MKCSRRSIPPWSARARPRPPGGSSRRRPPTSSWSAATRSCGQAEPPVRRPHPARVPVSAIEWSRQGDSARGPQAIEVERRSSPCRWRPPVRRRRLGRTPGSEARGRRRAPERRPRQGDRRVPPAIWKREPASSQAPRARLAVFAFRVSFWDRPAADPDGVPRRGVGARGDRASRSRGLPSTRAVGDVPGPTSTRTGESEGRRLAGGSLGARRRQRRARRGRAPRRSGAPDTAALLGRQATSTRRRGVGARGAGRRPPRRAGGSAPTAQSNPTGRIIGRAVLGGLHHVYQHATCPIRLASRFLDELSKATPVRRPSSRSRWWEKLRRRRWIAWTLAPPVTSLRVGTWRGPGTRRGSPNPYRCHFVATEGRRLWQIHGATGFADIAAANEKQQLLR